MTTTTQRDEPAFDSVAELAPVSGVRHHVNLRIREGSAASLSTLEIDAPLRHDVITNVQAALFAARVQVVRTHAQVTLRRVVRELEIAEFDGAPVSQRRARELERVLARELAAVVKDDPAQGGPRLRKADDRAFTEARRVATNRP